MKKIILFLMLGCINVFQAQLTEIYNFGYTGPSSNDFGGETRERIFGGKFFYYYQENATKKTFLYYKDTSSAEPVSVKDITATSAQTTAMTSIMTYKANDKYLYFTTYTYITSTKGINEIWRTDGTESGTVKIKSFEGAPVNFFNIKSVEYSVRSNVAAKNSINGDFIFSSSPTPATRAVWITNGTPEGTIKLIENTVTNTATAAYSPIDKIGNRMMFTVFGSTGYWEIWSTDGTAAGTQFHSRLFATLGLLNGKYYYATFDDQIANVISYTSDGITSAKLALSLPVDGIDGYIYDNKEMYLGSALGKALYHTTDFSDLKKIADIPQTNTYFLAATDSGLLYAKLLNVNLSDEYTFYFASRNAGVRAVNTGSMFVSSQDTFAFRNTFYTPTALKTDTQINGRELWRMDDQHTELFKDIYPGFLSFSGYTFPNNSSPKGFFSYNDEMYFLADQANGKKLFKFNPDFTFSNAGQDNKWGNPSNWKAGATPMSTDNAQIPSSFNVEINATAYIRDFQVSSPVNLTSGILNVSGNMALGSKITLNNSSMILKGNTSKISGSNTSNYIVTNGNSKVVVENLDSSRGTVMLPVGTSNHYNPVVISNSGVSDFFTVGVSEGVNNSAEPSVNVTCDISEGISGGSNAKLSFGWNQSQENEGFQRNTAKIGHYKNGQWTEENSGSVTGNNPYSISATSITGFSPFSVMNFATLGTINFNKNKMLAYPNPTTDILNFSQPLKQIQVFDRSGKLLKTFRDTNRINISDLTVGSYIINYIDKNENKNFEKIIKQ